MAKLASTWGPTDRERVRWARGVLRHSQKDAAEYVNVKFGGRVDKNQWSRWETGQTDTPRAEAQHTLRLYIATAEHADAVDVDAPSRDRPTEDVGGSDFDDIIQGIGSAPMFREPSFGELQRELLKADIARHATVGSLSELDYRRLKELEGLLGLTVQKGPPSE